MEIRITGRNVELNDELKGYIYRKFEKLERLYARIKSCEIILEEEKLRKNVEIIMHLKRNKLVARESSPDMYASIDNATETIKKRLRRLSGKVSSKRRKAMISKIMRPSAFFKKTEEFEEIVFSEENEKIVKMNLFADKPMLPEEAKLEVELGNRIFVMFKNADTGEVNVLYRKNDGDYGLIEPNF